jgi:hypothetical protein
MFENFDPPKSEVVHSPEKKREPQDIKTLTTDLRIRENSKLQNSDCPMSKVVHTQKRREARCQKLEQRLNTTMGKKR